MDELDLEIEQSEQASFDDLEPVFGSVPPIPGSDTADFEGHIRGAMEEEAERITAPFRASAPLREPGRYPDPAGSDR